MSTTASMRSLSSISSDNTAVRLFWVRQGEGMLRPVQAQMNNKAARGTNVHKRIIERSIRHRITSCKMMSLPFTVPHFARRTARIRTLASRNRNNSAHSTFHQTYGPRVKFQVISTTRSDSTTGQPADAYGMQMVDANRNAAVSKTAGQQKAEQQAAACCSALY